MALCMQLPAFELVKFSPSSVLSLTALSLLALCVLQYYRFSKLHRHLRLPPGSFGFPFIGETLEFAFNNTCSIGTPPPFFSSRLVRHGPIFKTHLLGRPTVVSMDPDLTRFLLNQEDKLVQACFPASMIKIMGPSLSLRGHLHLLRRDIATAVAGPATIHSVHLDAFQQHVLSSLQAWHNLSYVDAQDKCRQLVFTYSSKIFMGLRSDDPVIQVLCRDFATIPNSFFTIPLDLPGTTFNRVRKVRDRIINVIKELVRRRQNAGQKMDTRNVERGSTNVMDEILLRCQHENEGVLQEQDVAEWIFTFWQGSFETTTLLFSLLIKFLSENAHVVDELRMEHLSIRNGKKMNEKLTWDDYKKMHFTELVINETLRLGPIAHLMLRDSLQDIYYKGIIIPKGWLVVLNFAMVHLDAKYFPNPLQFDPWRWQGTAKSSSCNLTAFGGGIRSCVGASLARLEASIFLHYLVTLFKWERIVGEHGHADVLSSCKFPNMQNGLHLKLESLSNL